MKVILVGLTLTVVCLVFALAIGGVVVATKPFMISIFNDDLIATLTAYSFGGLLVACLLSYLK